MYVLSGTPGRMSDALTGTLLVKTDVPHTCDSCRKRIKVGSPAYFAWDVNGAYFVHRECKVRVLVNRKTAIPDPLPALPTVVPVVDKRKRGSPKNKWEAERIGWDGRDLR